MLFQCSLSYISITTFQLSAFAKMWNALFTWTTSSTLAYIYGRDDSLHEEYLLVNGRDYPQKIVLGDGRSSEIKQTLAGSLARALPGLVADLRLPTPISSLEQGMVLMWKPLCLFHFSFSLRFDELIKLIKTLH